MPHDYLNPGAQLPLVPGFAFLRRHLRSEHRYPDAFLRQNAFQPAGHIPLLRIDRVDLSYEEYGLVESGWSLSLNFS